jgi:hypothetical protein
MTDVMHLEQSYRRWLRCYPRSFRREHESEILGVLMAGAGSGRREPAALECLDLVRGGLWIRLRPTAPRSARSVFTAIKLMYIGALVELATAVTVLVTIGNVRSNVAERDPGLTASQWHAVVLDQLRPLVVAACVAVVFWLAMAWAHGRGHRWTPIAFGIFFAMNTDSLVQGVTRGSPVYARPDLAIGTVLWAIELAVIAVIGHSGARRFVASRGDVRSQPQER